MTGIFRRHRHEPRVRPPGTGPGAAAPSGLRSLLNMRSAAGQVFVLQVVIVVLLVAAAVTAMVLQAKTDSEHQAELQSVAAAEAFANAPGMLEALDSRDPTAVLQPRAEVTRKKAGVDFLVVMDTTGTRITHPDPARIGQKFIGTIEPSLAGRTTVESAEGPVRRGVQTEVVQAVVPVTDADGKVVGMVSAGLTVQSVTGLGERHMPIIFVAGAAALVLATTGAGLVSRRLRRQTHGLGPAEMTRMYEHHEAVLHAVREGVLITTADGGIQLVNDEARRLLELPADVEGRHVRELGLDATMTRLLASGEPVTDEVYPAGDRLLAVNIRPTAPYGGSAGSVVTLRDTTELAAVTGRAEMARGRLMLLYEAGVRVGTTLDVERTAEELADVAVPGFADLVTVDLMEPVLRGDEPSGTTGLRRAAFSGGPPEVRAMYPVGETITFVAASPQMRALESGRAVLETDLASVRDWHKQNPDRSRKAQQYGVHALVTVPLQARGVVLGLANFWRSGDTPAFEEEDLSFAEELAARAAVAIDNARRFTREHAMAVTLQHSLLPRALPEQDALEVAWRYLPAEAGVGGDWFDVIPLSGARVALVVGDVVGHGLHAAATMGRLRTAVHNFSALDLPVDELLGRLDDLVARIDSEEDPADDGPRARESKEVTGATCLYAIYDPVTGRCTVARAGHPGPAVVHPDGSVTHPDVPASLPLGLGGHPFETTELQLPEGSQLVLYTDGLIESRDRDIDVGLGQLQDVLAGEPARTPEDTCQAVLDAMLPEHASDDVALMVARTRLVAPSKVAEWEVRPDPAAVAPVRAQCGAQLRDWGFEEIGFATELILSELITNAIRYGAPPIKVRLLHNRSLICEVSDGSSTSPHMRRARATDEDGRGLFLVAQFAQRWGTRYTPAGKVIWTEQPLHNGEFTIPDTTPADALLDQFDDLTP